MTKTQNELKTIIDSISDTDLIQKLAGLNKLVEEDNAEYQALMDKHLALQKDYKEAILHSSFKEEPKDNLDGPKPVNFMDVVANIIG